MEAETQVKAMDIMLAGNTLAKPTSHYVIYGKVWGVEMAQKVDGFAMKSLTRFSLLSVFPNVLS